MIARKLAAFFTVMAFMAFVGTYLVRVALDQPVAQVPEMMGTALLVMTVYFVLGIYLAQLGVALISEVIEERRHREEERRERARARYQQVVGDEGLGGEGGAELI